VYGVVRGNNGVLADNQNTRLPRPPPANHKSRPARRSTSPPSLRSSADLPPRTLFPSASDLRKHRLAALLARYAGELAMAAELLGRDFRDHRLAARRSIVFPILGLPVSLLLDRL